MKLLRISMYLLIIFAIAKITSGSKPQLPNEAEYENIISYRPSPLLRSNQQAMDFDSTSYLNHYSNLQLKHKPVFPEMPKQRSDFNFSFIVF